MTLLPPGRLKRIHVNQYEIRRRSEKPLRIKVSGHNLEASEVVVRGESRVVYRPDRPLSCGARCWVETRAELEYR